MNPLALAPHNPDSDAMRAGHSPAAAEVRQNAHASSFQDQWTDLFETHHARLFRYLDRLSGDPELAADLAQETFIRLYRRKHLPDKPEAWLITVALNLFRNARSTQARRRRLLSIARAVGVHSDAPLAPASPGEADEPGRRVRAALQTLPHRDQNLLLLRAEGFSYHDIASALKLNEASIGTLLARARHAFSQAFEATDAP